MCFILDVYSLCSFSQMVLLTGFLVVLFLLEGVAGFFDSNNLWLYSFHVSLITIFSTDNINKSIISYKVCLVALTGFLF